MNPSVDNESTLAGIVLSPDNIAALDAMVAANFKESDFLTPAGRILLAAMNAHRLGKPIDLVNINDWLTPETIEDLGGRRALHRLVDYAPPVGHVVHFITSLREEVVKRRITTFATSWAEAARNGTTAKALLENIVATTRDMQETYLPTKDQFPRITYNDLMAYTVSERDHIIGEGWARRGVMTLLTGGTGLGKTVLVEQIGASSAGGVPILEHLKVHAPIRVMYVGAENDVETLKRDILSITKNTPGKLCPLLIETNLHMFHVYGMTGARFAGWLESRVKRDKPDLIIIDPYQAFIGGADINQSETFLSWIEPIEKIIKTHKCALILVAHTPKPKDRATWTERESVYIAAGSSVLSNWARCSAELTQDGSKDGRFRLRFGKNAERTGLHDDQGRIVRDLFIEHSGARLEPFWRISQDQLSKPSAVGKYDDRIRSMIAADVSASDSQIAKKIGCDRSTVNRVRRKLSL